MVTTSTRRVVGDVRVGERPGVSGDENVRRVHTQLSLSLSLSLSHSLPPYTKKKSYAHHQYIGEKGQRKWVNLELIHNSYAKILQREVMHRHRGCACSERRKEPHTRTRGTPRCPDVRVLCRHLTRLDCSRRPHVSVRTCVCDVTTLILRLTVKYRN